MAGRNARKLPNEAKKLVGYVRVSSTAGRDDERFRSPDLQRRAIEQWADARYGVAGHVWLDWIEELDRTGSSQDRPGLNKARDLAIANGADIVVYDFARYSRSVPEGLSDLARLQDAGVQVLSASEYLDASTPEGELSLTIFMAMHQHYLRRIGQTWRKQIADARADGWWHGVPPYGYRRPSPAEAKKFGRTSGVIVPDSTTAKRVQYVFEEFLNGKNIYTLGTEGRKKGWWTRPVRAREIVMNASYAGMVPVSSERVPARSVRTGDVLKDGNGRTKTVPVPGTTRYRRGRHKPLVSAKDFVRARKKIEAERKGRAPRPTGPRWSAAGLTRCATCGHKLRLNDKSAAVKSGSGFYLVCANPRCDGHPGSIRIEDLEVVLAAAMAELPFQVDDVAAIAQQQLDRGLDGDKEAQAQLRRQQARLRTNLTSLTTAILSGDYEDLGVTAEEARQARDSVRSQLTAVETKLEGIEAASVEPNELASLAGQVHTLAGLWEAMTLEERVAALDAIGCTVKILPARKHGDTLDGRVVLTFPFDVLAELEARTSAVSDQLVGPRRSAPTRSKSARPSKRAPAKRTPTKKNTAPR